MALRQASSALWTSRLAAVRASGATASLALLSTQAATWPEATNAAGQVGSKQATAIHGMGSATCNCAACRTGMLMHQTFSTRTFATTGRAADPSNDQEGPGSQQLSTTAAGDSRTGAGVGVVGPEEADSNPLAGPASGYGGAMGPGGGDASVEDPQHVGTQAKEQSNKEREGAGRQAAESGKEAKVVGARPDAPVSGDGSTGREMDRPHSEEESSQASVAEASDTGGLRKGNVPSSWSS